ncbi:hypothetical protein D3C78_1546290 [compost metagenome]
MAVTGPRRERCAGQLMLMALTLLCVPRLPLTDGRRIGTHMQFALVGIEQHRGAVTQRQHLHRHPADRRQTAGARKNRHVTGCAAADRGKTQHLAGINAGGLRRGQLIGNQNASMRQLHRLLAYPQQ